MKIWVESRKRHMRSFGGNKRLSNLMQDIHVRNFDRQGENVSNFDGMGLGVGNFVRRGGGVWAILTEGETYE